ncbi:MAG: arsenate reductase ArsC [Gammaproteobacteria bacterium]|nr:arsenate reductase ArsC [Gammaproteobacteria bacterium]
MKRALILCTGNSCRSVMAEALFNELGRGRYQAFSAGSIPAGHVHPQAIATLRRHGVEPGQPRSKSWDEFAGQPFDLVITVCDEATGETCPAFTGEVRRLHWSTPDPAKAAGGKEDMRCAFDLAYSQLRARIEALLAASQS